MKPDSYREQRLPEERCEACIFSTSFGRHLICLKGEDANKVLTDLNYEPDNTIRWKILEKIRVKSYGICNEFKSPIDY